MAERYIERLPRLKRRQAIYKALYRALKRRFANINRRRLWRTTGKRGRRSK